MLSFMYGNSQRPDINALKERDLWQVFNISIYGTKTGIYGIKKGIIT